MGILKLWIDGEPVAKGRARAAIRGGRISHYTPEKTLRYEDRVKRAAMAVMEGTGQVMAVGPVSVKLRAYMVVPESWSASKRRIMEANGRMHVIKPDMDNIVKAVLDGCNGVVWKDDCQVCEMEAKKAYAGPGERVGVELVVEWLE